MSKPTPRRRLLVAGVSLLLGLFVAELVAARAPSRTQAVRPSAIVQVDEQDGVPLWYVDARDGARREDCEDPRVMIFGTSVLAGISVPREALFSEALRTFGCVENHAVAGYAGETMLARAQRELPGARPDVVLWEVSGSALETYTRVGAAVYNLRGAPAPAPWVGQLVSRSRLLELLWMSTIQLPERPPGDPVGRYRETLAAFLSLAAAEGARVGVIFAPPLNRPFATFAKDPGPLFTDLKGWLGARDVAWLDLATALSDDDVVALRLDECCHFNVAGHARVGAVVKEWVRPWLEPG